MRATIRCLLPLLALGAPALAQNSAIRGFVRDSSRRMLADAEVIVTPGERRVRTDSAGNFYITGLAPGTYQLRARRLGFYPVQVSVVLAANSEKQLAFELEPRPVLLDTINVTESCGRLGFSSFVCRRRNGTPGGIFMDVDQIDSANARFVQDLFRRPGFRVEAATGRAGGLRIVPLTGWRCMKAIVNGQPPSITNPMPSSPAELLGVEIYADQADVPTEYDGYAWGAIRAGRRTVSARCTLVVYWTLVRPRKG